MESSQLSLIEEDQDNSFFWEPEEEESPSVSTFSQINFLTNVDKIVGFTPEITYISGMSIDLFSQNIFSDKENILYLSATQTRMGTDLWNEIDSLCAIYYGLRLITDKNNYRRKTCIIQGILNIITGVTMGYFTDNKQICLGLLMHASSTILASPFFALATACDLLNASINLYHTSQELSFEDWLAQRLKELDFIEERIRQETLTKNHSQLILLNNKKNELHFQIINRCLARSDNPHSRKDIETALKNTYPDLWEKCTYYSPEIVNQAKIIDQEIQQQINERYESQRKILFMKTLSFVGMTLLAVVTFAPCPPLLILGSAICTIVALYYLQKNVLNLFSFFKDCRKNSGSKGIPEQSMSNILCAF